MSKQLRSRRSEVTPWNIFDSRSGTPELDSIDQRLGNTNLNGVWFFRLDANPIGDSPAKKCYKWYHLQEHVTIPWLPPCPCHISQALVDKRFFVGQIVPNRSPDAICAYTRPVIEGHWVQQCCYARRLLYGRILTTGNPDGGSPFIYRSQKIPGFVADTEAYEYCCKQSTLCALYYNRRPSQTCAGYRRRRRGEYFLVPSVSELIVVLVLVSSVTPCK